MNRKCICIRTPKDDERAGESGYILLSVILMVALLTIALAVAEPKIALEIRRDKELECMHRGQQYSRAIRFFYRSTGNYPTDLAQLENTNGLRFLRRRYLDPITRGEWRPVYQGEVKPEILSLPWYVSGSRSSVGSPGYLPTGIIFGIAGGVPANAYGYGENGGVTQILNSSTGQFQVTPGNSTPDNSDAQSTSGSPGSQLIETTATSDTPISNRRIVGVSSWNNKASLRIYKKQTHYNDWQFVYDPASEGLVGGGMPEVNGPARSSSSPAQQPASAQSATPSPSNQSPVQ